MSAIEIPSSNNVERSSVGLARWSFWRSLLHESYSSPPQRRPRPPRH